MRTLSFDERGLIPAVVQDRDGGAVLMVGYMNTESLERTLATGQVHFWSRSRERLWRKGETSGNTLELDQVLVDCDQDTLLLKVTPRGPTCHTGARSCFFEDLEGGRCESSELPDRLGVLARTIRDRRMSRPEGSYTTKLFASGVDRIAQKVGEEATEVVIAATKNDPEALAEETADLLYHLLVLLEASGVSPERVAEVLEARHRDRGASR